MLSNNHKPQNDKPDSPIFIMGCHRTGTTLVRQILRCHSRLEIFHETQFYPIFHDEIKYYGDFNNQSNLIRFIKDFHHTLGMLGLEPGVKYLPDTDEILSTLGKPSCEAVFSATLSLYAKKHGKQRGGEKTPKHVSFLPLILERYPDSPVIFLMRDPRDTVHSMHKSFKTTIKGACNLWNESVYQYKKASRPVFLVKYEELVKTPEKVIREMCGFIGETYEASMLHFYEKKPESVLLKKGGKLLGEIDSDSIGNYKNLTTGEIKEIEAECAYGMQLIEYPFTMSRSESVSEPVIQPPAKINIVRFIIDRLLYYNWNLTRWKFGWMRWRIQLKVRGRYYLTLAPLRKKG